MITSTNGDLLAADVEALVNTVNCVGVMGKGLALQFKRRFPDVFRAYERACRSGEVRIGSMFVVETGQMDGPRYVINFPTKQHWRSPSKLEYIDNGLEDLRRVIRELGLRSIAVPPLGAGNGGLDWSEVEPRLRRAFEDLKDVDVRLYAPLSNVRSLAPTTSVKMTWGRAILLNLLRRYAPQRYSVEPWEDARGASHLEIQKLMYFADFMEPDLRLNFQSGRYGPYSDLVRHLIQEMEGSYLTGFGDGTGRVLNADPIEPTERGLEDLRGYAESRDTTREDAVVTAVLDTLEGFEGPYGIELLASTHWVATRQQAWEPSQAACAVRSWTERKGRLFTDADVEAALRHIHARSELARLPA